MADISTYIGILAFIVGMFLVFAPSILKKVNEFSAKSVTKIDTLAFAYRVWFGVSLLLISVFMFLMAYQFSRRGY